MLRDERSRDVATRDHRDAYVVDTAYTHTELWSGPTP